MTEIFRIKRGDTSPAIRVALEPATIDLTGATVLFQMRRRRGALVVDSAAVVESPLPPIVRYDWADGDTAHDGPFEAEFRVTFADGTTETFPNTKFISVVIGEDIR
jgi:hypothetical protein